MAVLMNTRGLVELIVLNVGLNLGILSQKLFSMMVVMAVVTTSMTPPLVYILTKTGEGIPDVEEKQSELGKSHLKLLLLLINDMKLLLLLRII